MPAAHPDRRQFLSATGSAFAALIASGCMSGRTTSFSADTTFADYGPLRSDPAGMLDLPEGFSYRILSSLGDAMSDGGTVPNLSLIHI